jgi:hypothetical protein
MSQVAWLRTSHSAETVADGVIGALVLMPSRMGEAEFRYAMGLPASIPPLIVGAGLIALRLFSYLNATGLSHATPAIRRGWRAGDPRMAKGRPMYKKLTPQRFEQRVSGSVFQNAAPSESIERLLGG